MRGRGKERRFGSPRGKERRFGSPRGKERRFGVVSDGGN
jgi:hypothetical protein